ncbi:hypothetical protein [Ktedonobacter robiniae]|jgi:ABC-type transport system involved in cytochrome bd biosynthesis fused ATPase/permease subunit|uniref:hypothetical protein n=1 Tax=Ktedonobacter robiniae TaxID=2778365 RepID=UPI0019155644|nr:hypothetical protein [Ktedonobacter robiniae]
MSKVTKTRQGLYVNGPRGFLAGAAIIDVTSGVLLLVTGPIIPLLMMLVGSFAEQRTRQ